MNRYNQGQIAISAIVAVAIFAISSVGGSYLFTETKAEAVSKRIDEHIAQQAQDISELKQANASIQTKLDLLLQERGIRIK